MDLLQSLGHQRLDTWERSRDAIIHPIGLWTHHLLGEAIIQILVYQWKAFLAINKECLNFDPSALFNPHQAYFLLCQRHMLNKDFIIPRDY